MKRIAQLAAGALLITGAANVAGAQEASDGAFFRAPTFAILPGALSTNIISAPEGVDSHTAFNARFQAVIPTRLSWLAFVGGAQWGPIDEEDHGAIIFLGGILPFTPLSTLTGGWLGASIDPLLVATGPGSDGMDFVGELALLLNFGSKMMPDMGYWSGASLFFLVDQNLTPAEDAAGDKDYWNPVLVYGLAIPIAPRPGGP